MFNFFPYLNGNLHFLCLDGPLSSVVHLVKVDVFDEALSSVMIKNNAKFEVAKNATMKIACSILISNCYVPVRSRKVLELPLQYSFSNCHHKNTLVFEAF